MIIMRRLMPALLLTACVQNAAETPVAASASARPAGGAAARGGQSGLLGTWRGTLVGGGGNNAATLRINEQRPDGSGSGTWRGAPIQFTGSPSSIRFVADSQAAVELELTPDGRLTGTATSNGGSGSRGRGVRSVTLARE